MGFRIVEAGDEIDGHIIYPARMGDGTYHIISTSQYPLATRLDTHIRQTDNDQSRAALKRSDEFPVATRGGSAEIHVRGRDGRGEFSATFYYNEKKMDGVGDAFAYR